MTAAPANAIGNGLAVADRTPAPGTPTTAAIAPAATQTIAVAREAARLAEFYSKSDMIPAQFRDKPANVFIALQFAWRIGMDPFMVMQGMYVVQGRPGLEAKFVIALVNASGLFADPLDFDFSGTPGKPDWTCTVSAKRTRTGKECKLDFKYSVAEAEGWVSKGGSKWKTMPDQMMRYRAAAFFARVYCPEVIMGMQTTDEIDDTPRETLNTLPEGRSSFRPEAMTGTGPAPTVEEANARLAELREKAAAAETTEEPKPAETDEAPEPGSQDAEAEPEGQLPLGGRRRSTR